ncbi:MAG: VCBS repeat-containing protein [Verrucomicrobia bacterium]|nr:VCBS repeat-containing protein [Verrucomicrobiota bacterium]
MLSKTPMYGLADYSHSYQLVDYDNDGDQDIFLPLETSSAKLYRNDGQLRFADVSTAVLKGRVPSGAGGSWADFDNDGDLDVISAGQGQAPIRASSWSTTATAPSPTGGAVPRPGFTAGGNWGHPDLGRPRQRWLAGSLRAGAPAASSTTWAMAASGDHHGSPVKDTTTTTKSQPRGRTTITTRYSGSLRG